MTSAWWVIGLVLAMGLFAVITAMVAPFGWKRWRALTGLLQLILLQGIMIIGLANWGLLGGAIIGGLAALVAALLATTSLTNRLADRLMSRYGWAVNKRLLSWTWLDSFVDKRPPAQRLRITSITDLRSLIEASKSLTANERHMIEAAMTLDRLKVGDVMKPLSAMESVRVEDAVGPLLLDELYRTRQTLFPVIDNESISGYVQLSRLVEARRPAQTVRSVMVAPIVKIHHDLSVVDACQTMLKEGVLLAYIDDGAKGGLVTLESLFLAVLGKDGR